MPLKKTQGHTAMTAGLFVPFVLGFFLGSIPFGLILTRMFGLGDIRKIGSGNIGATNVLRTGNKALAALTLLLDVGKGTAAVLLAVPLAVTIADALDVPLTMNLSERAGDLRQGGFSLVQAQLMAGFGAFLGHLYPPWLGFRGGKGVATYIGVLAGLFWPAALAFCGAWLATAATARMSSLAALVASVVAPIATWWLGRFELALPMAVLSALLIYRHRANIQRLLAGEEPRIGEKA